MVNITYKSTTLRRATAQALVTVSKQSTIQAILDRQVPKGDVLVMAKAAGLLAAKHTSDVIPDCHPLPIEFADIRYEINDLTIRVEAEIHTVYKTGVEVEAMHTASVVALTMYDMLKPIDPIITIEKIKLLEKRGGKGDFTDKSSRELRAAVVVCSDSIAKGVKQDRAGRAIIEKLKTCGVAISDYSVIPDEKEIIQQKARHHAQQGLDLVLFTGGTGLSPRDVTPEALLPLLDKTIPGIEEAIRAYGQQRTPYSMLSRSVAGLMGDTLIMALPGSTRGAEESMDAVFPHVLHIFRVMAQARHD
jgi:molybdenum cofactor biosynthesis protein MoaC